MVEVKSVGSAEINYLSGPLSAIVAETVEDGAAISFMQPFTVEDGARFWRDEVAPEVASGRRRLFAAFHDDAPIGAVQLILALPPNQPHRCEIAKMMVRPNARRRGVGRALLEAAEACARAEGRSLITLDTRTGDVAERLYASCGFSAAGVIPGYALDPDGAALHGTTYMYKSLD